MNTPHNEWDAYLTQMEQLLALELDDARRAELRVQFSRIAAMAGPLLAFPLD
ncbi:MAG: oxalurate catabolism protein HpxX, partial [Klebsiella michiganensis]|nr:oxalurate catabolism protein HpxX [Klebsiella michiganensis]